MAGEIVAYNGFLEERAKNLKALFASGHGIRLYQNDLAPSPKDGLNAFTESSFPNYSRVSLVSKFGDVSKVIDGEYRFSTIDITWTSTGPTLEKCFGWYIVAGNDLKLSCRLPFPVQMTTGQSVTIRVDVLTWAASIL